MSDIAFVRTAMLPPATPPVTERGAVKWVRENLFSSPTNTVLTLVGVYAVYSLITLALPWLLHGVWFASSLSECRSIIAENFGPDAGGACWAMIRLRWYQFIFGFYPPELWWRPTLNFALMFVALAPVLFSDNPGKARNMVGIVAVLFGAALMFMSVETTAFVLTIAVMAALFAVSIVAPMRLLWVTMLFPFVSLFLLWGGSVWGPVMVLAGFGVLAVVYRLLTAQLGVVVATSAGFLAACLWWFLADTHAAALMDDILPFSLTPMDSDRFGGFLLAFVIGVSSISISLPIGILLALGRQSNMFLIRTLSIGFIEFVRGVPLITMLFTASLLLGYFLPPQTNFDLILRVVILVTFFAAAYNAEVVRGGLAALPRGQYEAADALGLDYWQAQRLVIMPQALKVAIPGIVTNFIGLFKDTTLVNFVGLRDPLIGITTVIRSDIAWKGIYWEPYLFVGAIFFLACFGMSRYSMYLEGKLKTDHR
jgi:general L-amino acid transport system permease protein